MKQNLKPISNFWMFITIIFTNMCMFRLSDMQLILNLMNVYENYITEYIVTNILLTIITMWLMNISKVWIYHERTKKKANSVKSK